MINDATKPLLLALDPRQAAELALSIAHRGYVLESGRLLLGGAADTLRTSGEVRRIFLGL